MKFFIICMIFITLINESMNQSDKQYCDYLTNAKIILDKYPLIDGHNDLPFRIRQNFRNDIQYLDLEDTSKYLFTESKNISHTDLKRLREGRQSGQFWAIFAPCSTTGKDAVRVHLEQIDLVKRIVKKYSNFFTFVTDSKGIVEAFGQRKFFSLLGVESGHAIDSSMGTLRMFYELGVRYMTLTHNCNVPWATSSLIDKKPNAQSYGGLNYFGREIIKEMNRLGMMVDISHVSEQTMNNVLEISRSPVIFSHSSAYALCNHTRNVKDYVLQKLKANNGVIMVNFYNNFVTCSGSATLNDVVAHLEHIKSLIGVDHIGIGADYDGVSRTPTDLEDVSKYPNLFAALLRNGWTEMDLAKLAGWNVIRVLRDNERYAHSVRFDEPSTMEIDPKLLESSDFAQEYANCRSDL